MVMKDNQVLGSRVIRRRGGRKKWSESFLFGKKVFISLTLYVVFAVLLFFWMYFFLSVEEESETEGPLNALRAIKKSSLRQNLKPTFPYFGSPVLDIENYEPLGGGRYDEWKHGDTPFQINLKDIKVSDDLARKRKTSIKAAMNHAWSGYRNKAFGYDELKPVSGEGDMNWSGLGTTLVDSLDTLWLMGMKDEFYECRDWVRDHLSHDKEGPKSVFENTIRSLGGLLSAYDWSGDDAFLEKAVDLGDRLLKAFDSPSGIPYSLVDLRSGVGENYKYQRRETPMAAAGTLQIEFRYLSKMTGNKTYAEKAEHVFELLRALRPKDGLYFTTVTNTEKQPIFGSNTISIGAFVDSFYEYMLKLWLQGGKTESKYREMYDESIEGIHKKLLQYTNPSGLAYLAKKRGDSNEILIHQFEHLECFMGGLMALGAHTDPLGPDSKRAKRDMKTAKALTYTCYQMYATTATGLGPDIVTDLKGDNKNEYDLRPKGDEAYYGLRPEVVESLYILNKITGDPVYREMGWEIFQSIEKFCKTQYGYGAHPDVRNKNLRPMDKMESFFLGETLKYLYLLMDPDSQVVLGKYVFNTEAHPLKGFNFLT